MQVIDRFALGYSPRKITEDHHRRARGYTILNQLLIQLFFHSRRKMPFPYWLRWMMIIHMESPYSPKPRTPAKASSVAYVPTPTQILRVQQMKLAQDKRIILNVGGQKFETSVSSLQKDPSSVLTYMVMPDSPLKPYNTDSVYKYFLDRKPNHFRHILNNSRYGGNPSNTFPHDVIYLKEQQREAEFYNRQHFILLLERRLAIPAT
ncbi:hypothetical protein CHS0354_016548 [Potamilus streckersoni]|uniref:Potassium channel tetramerisation-type BTB domain-containing protein n=1 Tax=Potamilus streckersoni TaxID=2493646 RepID=A0AAE0WEC6_9BIVA|nr:hypothetical protein CHS0354_016548 [Potamilus streckersoni]